MLHYDDWIFSAVCDFLHYVYHRQSIVSSDVFRVNFTKFAKINRNISLLPDKFCVITSSWILPNVNLEGKFVQGTSVLRPAANCLANTCNCGRVFMAP